MKRSLINISIGKKLRLKRTVLGISQSALGKMLGITFQQVQKYEKGINSMNAIMLEKVCVALATPITYFFESDEKNAIEQSIYGFSEEKKRFTNQGATSKETISLIKNFNKITDPALRKKVASLVKSLAENK